MLSRPRNRLAGAADCVTESRLHRREVAQINKQTVKFVPLIVL